MCTLQKQKSTRKKMDHLSNNKDIRTGNVQGPGLFSLQGECNKENVNGNFDNCTKEVLAVLQVEESGQSEEEC